MVAFCNAIYVAVVAVKTNQTPRDLNYLEVQKKFIKFAKYYVNWANGVKSGGEGSDSPPPPLRLMPSRVKLKGKTNHILNVVYYGTCTSRNYAYYANKLRYLYEQSYTYFFLFLGLKYQLYIVLLAFLDYIQYFFLVLISLNQ